MMVGGGTVIMVVAVSHMFSAQRWITVMHTKLIHGMAGGDEPRVKN